MEAFVNAFGVFALLLDLGILGFLIYCLVRSIRRRGEIIGRVGKLKWLLSLAGLLFLTLLFVVATFWWLVV